MSIYWFISFIVLIILELVTINLVSIWFAIGAIAAMFVSFFTKSITIQLLVFIVVSIIALFITKPIIKKVKSKEIIPTNFDRLIGKEAIVIKSINKNEFGEVKIFGTIWTAYSEKKIEKGSKVKVLAIDGVKLIVKEEEN